MIVLALILSWLPPLADCDGGMPDVDHYLLETERIVKTGEVVSADGSITDVATRTFTSAPLSTVTLSAVLTDPSVGGMIAWRVAAYDLAGNRDCETEVPTP
jgi:hypothetical protein